MISERTLEREPGQRRDQLERVREAYEAAAERTGRVERRFRIAGHLVVLEFAGEALVPYLTPALSHLSTDDSGAPELRIRVFDSESSSVGLPFTRDELVELNAGGMPAAQAVEGIHASYQRPDSGLSFLDVGSGEGWYWVPAANGLPYWEMASPLRGLFQLWARGQCLLLLHAGAVGRQDRGVLIVGPSGSGKSTTALACLAFGMTYISDDLTLVDELSPVNAYPLYSMAKLEFHQLDRLPWARRRLVASPDQSAGKAIIATGGERRARSMSVSALLLPQVVPSGELAIRPASPAEAFRALAPSSLLHFGAADQRLLEGIKRISTKTPAFQLDIIGDPAGIPGVVNNLLSQVI